jgi:hypothetical protein
MLLSYNDEEDEIEQEEEYYDALDSDQWSGSVVGTWKDLE